SCPFPNSFIIQNNRDSGPLRRGQISQTRHSWAGAMRHLIVRGYFVINYDARGHGDSDWSSDGDYSIGALASDLRAVLSTITGPVALVGASMGGITSFYAIGAADYPIADALVMVDIALRPASAGVRKIQQFMTGIMRGSRPWPRRRMR
ncbi:MAG: alpha/beta fold hydrolase, partial [Sphingobium sp.]|uniref:alpha/beta fold hydrolase n=1 Tax=Sphingobium sp. TaxID=1912891 RepID=UPI0029AA1543